MLPMEEVGNIYRIVEKTKESLTTNKIPKFLKIPSSHFPLTRVMQFSDK